MFPTNSFKGKNINVLGQMQFDFFLITSNNLIVD